MEKLYQLELEAKSFANVSTFSLEVGIFLSSSVKAEIELLQKFRKNKTVALVSDDEDWDELQNLENRSNFDSTIYDIFFGYLLTGSQIQIFERKIGLMLNFQ